MQGEGAGFLYFRIGTVMTSHTTIIHELDLVDRNFYWRTPGMPPGYEPGNDDSE